MSSPKALPYSNEHTASPADTVADIASQEPSRGMWHHPCVRDFVRLVFWIWFCVSVVILVARAIRRRPSTPSTPPTGPTSPHPPPTPTHPTPPTIGPRRDGHPETAANLDVWQSRPDAATNVFASPDHGAVHGSADAPSTSGRRVSLAEALSGIRMPGDLVPLVSCIPPPTASDSVSFVGGDPPEAVGPALVSELERLGYSTSVTSNTTLRATREGIVVNVEVHTNPHAVHRSGVAAFSGVREGQIVVEFWIA